MDNRSKHPVVVSHMNMGYPASLNKINQMHPYNHHFLNINRAYVPSNSFIQNNLASRNS